MMVLSKIGYSPDTGEKSYIYECGFFVPTGHKSQKNFPENVIFLLLVRIIKK